MEIVLSIVIYYKCVILCAICPLYDVPVFYNKVYLSCVDLTLLSTILNTINPPQGWFHGFLDPDLFLENPG